MFLFLFLYYSALWRVSTTKKLAWYGGKTKEFALDRLLRLYYLKY